MPSVEIKNFEGKKSENLQLKDQVFGLDVDDALVHQAYVAIYSNRRSAIAHTKTRAERSGSGRKPWKQKGTGRARVGSVRTPVWRKGGVVFGPRNVVNFQKKINKKMNELAIKMVLSGKLADSQLVVVESLENKEKKTKYMAKGLENLKIKGSVLIAFDNKEKENKIFSRNLKEVKNVAVDSLNVFDMLNNKLLMLSKEGVRYLEEKYSK